MFNKIYEKIKNFIKNNYLFIILMIFIIFMFYYETPYMIYRSGGTIDLNNRVIVDKDYTQKGSISMSYVTAMKGSPAFVLLSYIIPDWDLEKISENSESSYDETLEIGKEYLKEGIDNAIIAAFNETSYNIEITKENIKAIFLSDKAKTDIKVGDLFLKINDKEINNFKEVKDLINSLQENEKVNIVVKNKDKEYERYAYIYKAEDNTLKIGVAFHTTYEYTTEIPVKVNMKNNESGSSGGLMMSLQIYNALTPEDITKGLKIVGTGTINADGTVTEIGGVKYKVLAASKAKADIFFCPEDNYNEAMAVKNKRNLKIEIVKVNSLKEVIDYLNSK